MEGLSELSQTAMETLIRNYMILVVVAVLILALVLYVYFFPTSIAEYFKDPGTDKKLPATGRV